eukprot:TRINITY_DN11636_c0_g1_i1.p1 TRINITY_DN11636_c0_g1~~TRINITY_DN11636_c0_g1_i1.p1  ORF type:complete len:370 (+),score=35.55 TRINITY_DN11636_c0_g1_i1:54-1163(+)
MLMLGHLILVNFNLEIHRYHHNISDLITSHDAFFQQKLSILSEMSNVNHEHVKSDGSKVEQTYGQETLDLFPFLDNGQVDPKLYHVTQLSSRYQVNSFADILWSSSSNREVGYGILPFIRKYSFAKHLIYSLLKGRPVVVLGKSKKGINSNVRDTVNTLSLFVCGAFGAIQWIQNIKSLTISTFTDVKLVGMSKEIEIPSYIEKCISIFDIDDETFIGPPYKGTFISTLVDDRDWPDEGTFIAYLHSELYGLAMRACLYYHLYYVLSSNSNGFNHTNDEYDDQSLDQNNSTKPTQPTLKQNLSQRSEFKLRADEKKNTMEMLEIAEYDIEIIENFVEVVKEQQFSEVNRLVNFKGLRLDLNSEIVTFKN